MVSIRANSGDATADISRLRVQRQMAMMEKAYVEMHRRNVQTTRNRRPVVSGDPPSIMLWGN